MKTETAKRIAYEIDCELMANWSPETEARVAEIIERWDRVDRFEQRGDAVIRWAVTFTCTLCIAAVCAAYVAQYLEAK